MSTDAEFVEKLRSLHFASSRKRGPKVSTDVHDHHTVDVTEHWDDRVSVNVKPETIHLPALPRTDARDSPDSPKGTNV